LAETPLGVQDFNQGKKLVTSLPIIGLVGGDIAVQAAKNFRILRSRAVIARPGRSRLTL
jgi:hypothetical protein